MSDLATLLGDASFWEAAKQAAGVTAPGPKTPRARRAPVPRITTVDPLQIEFLGAAEVVRPQPGAGCDYQMVGGIAELREYLRPCFEAQKAYAGDWEANSLNQLHVLPVGFSCSVSPKTARYAPVGHLLSPGDNLPVREVLQIQRELDDLKVYSLWYNAGYDHAVTRNASGGWVPTYWHDAQIAVYLLDSNVIELNLKSTASRLLGVRMQTIEELDEEWVQLSKKARKQQPPKLPHQLPADRVMPYACADSDVTRQLFFLPQVQAAIKDQIQVFQLEESLQPIVNQGVWHGIYLDVERLRELQKEAIERIEELKPLIFAALGCEPFPLSKRAKLGEQLLLTKAIGAIDTNERSSTYGQWVVPRTDKGMVATDKKTLDKYRKQHAALPLLIEHAELDAQERNYIRKLIKGAEFFATQPWAEGRCRFAFNTIGVPTGRMKCGGAGRAGEAYYKGMLDVNGQSLPDHEKAPYLPNTRSGIKAPPGYVVVAADYSQIELRLAANESKEPVWIQAYREDKDLHLVNAQAIANFREPGVTVLADDKMRRGKAKTTSFALLYGGDEYTVARNAGIPPEEAKEVLDAFFKGLPTLKAWIDRTQNSARLRKRVRTFLGRVRHLDKFFHDEPSRRDRATWVRWKKLDARGCREAINDPIQGGAADVFKLACLFLHRAVQAQGWGLDIISPQIYWVHDEVVYYVKEEWVTRVVPVLKAAMEFPVRGWEVPIKAEFEVGSRILYSEAKATKARKEAAKAEKYDDAAAIAKWQAEAAKWDRAAALPESSNYGELVGLDTWLARYAPAQTEAVA